MAEESGGDFIPLNNLGFTPQEILRSSGFHSGVVRVLAGAEVIKCSDGGGKEWVLHLTREKIPGKTLLHEARMAKCVAGLAYRADNNWTVNFPGTVKIFSDQKITITAYPFIRGADGIKLIKEYSDNELTAVGRAALEGMQALTGSLSEEEKSSLFKNKVGERIESIGLPVISRLLVLKGMLGNSEASALLSLEKKGRVLSQSLPLRLIHHDLHTFNIISNLEEKSLTVVDLGMLSLGRSMVDYGRWLTYLLIADRKTAMNQLESELLGRKMITKEMLAYVKAGGLLGWGRELIERPTKGKEPELEIGKKLWKEEVRSLLHQT